MEKLLKSFQMNEIGKVKRIEATSRIRQRLFDMGITPGTEILLKKIAPLGDPIEVRVRGYELSLRKSEAEGIIMEVEK